MDALQHHLPDLALAAALAWGAGLRLYLVCFAFGLAGFFGWPLPEHLQVLQHPLVLGASGFMTAVELLADKLPWLDSVWDAVHTLVRIPAGAALAAAVFGDSGGATALAAALLGGSVTAATHFAKAGARAAANTSPEPFSNLALSLSEDAAVLGGTWLAVHQPLAFMAALLLFLVAGVMLVRAVGRRVARLLARRGHAPGVPPA